MVYQLGWTTLPGLRGLSVSDFRAEAVENPDTERGIAVEFAHDAACKAFLKAAEADFAERRFNNAADAFDTVKAYIQDRAGKREGS
jgi:hypothetical protein